MEDQIVTAVGILQFLPRSRFGHELGSLAFSMESVALKISDPLIEPLSVDNGFMLLHLATSTITHVLIKKRGQGSSIKDEEGLRHSHPHTHTWRH